MALKFSIPEKVWFKEGLRSPLRSVLVVFYHRRSRDWRVVFRSYEEVATFTGMGEEKAKRSINRLIQLKLIKRDRQGVYTLKRGGRNLMLPSSLATSVLTYKERAYLSLIWSLRELQGDGEFTYLNLMDLARLTGESKWNVWQTLRDLTSKDLLSKERHGNFIRLKPLFPILP